MKIHQLELFNFKSYKGHHVIGPFEEFTCIIGPNGSGKSNLMDAVSFVVGIQNKKLRSDNCRELITQGEDEMYVKLILSSGKVLEKMVTATASGDGGVQQYKVNGKKKLEREGLNLNYFLQFQNQLQEFLGNPRQLSRLIEDLSGGGGGEKEEYEKCEEEKKSIEQLYDLKQLEYTEVQERIATIEAQISRQEEYEKLKEMILKEEARINEIKLENELAREQQEKSLQELKRKLSQEKKKILQLTNENKSREDLKQRLSVELELLSVEQLKQEKLRDKQMQYSSELNEIMMQIEQLETGKQELKLSGKELKELNRLEQELKLSQLNKRLHLEQIEQLHKTKCQNRMFNERQVMKRKELSGKLKELSGKCDLLKAQEEIFNRQQEEIVEKKNLLFELQRQHSPSQHNNNNNNSFIQVKQLFRVKDEKFQLAIEALLVKHLNSCVANNQLEAIEFIHQLKQQRLPPTTFLLLDQCQVNNTNSHLVELLDIFDCKYIPLFQYLLDNCTIGTDYNPRYKKVATVDGIVYNNNGTIFFYNVERISSGQCDYSTKIKQLKEEIKALTGSNEELSVGLSQFKQLSIELASIKTQLSQIQLINVNDDNDEEELNRLSLELKQEQEIYFKDFIKSINEKYEMEIENISQLKQISMSNEAVGRQLKLLNQTRKLLQEQIATPIKDYSNEIKSIGNKLSNIEILPIDSTQCTILEDEIKSISNNNNNNITLVDDEVLKSLKEKSFSLKPVDNYLELTQELQQLKSNSINKQIQQLSTQKKKIKDKFLQLKQRRRSLFQSTLKQLQTRVDMEYKRLLKSNSVSAYLTVDNLQEPWLSNCIFSVRPLNKRFRPIDQLSGGEKTLACLALLFSFKKSLVFVFDEIDACLDAKNQLLLSEYLQSQKHQQQFICISLKPKFFELSDALIGIYKPQSHYYSQCLSIKLLS